MNWCPEQYCKIWDLRCSAGRVPDGRKLMRSWSSRRQNLAKEAVKRTHAKGEKTINLAQNQDPGKQH